MKRILILIFFFISVFAKGQVYQLMPQYGYDAKRMKFDSTLQIPTFCGVPSLRSNILNKSAIAYDSCNKRFYYYDPKLAVWDTIKGGGSASIDTLSLSNRINQKVDSIKRNSDSVYFYKNGIGYFAFRDSVQNGRWGNDTALVILAKVHNGTGTTLARGTVVMISGSNGDVASVILANNKYDSTSARTIGLVKDPINSGDTGWVVTQGQASKLNLGSYTAGDVLYLDSIDGGLTKTKPIAPYHQVFVCIVERANNGNGLAYVKPLNGQEIEELHDVRIITPLNNHVLVYSDTQQIWKNRNVYSVVDTTSLSNRINTLTLDSVVKKGNASSLPIYVYGHLGITDASATGDGKINYDNYEYYFTNQDDEEILKFYKNTLILLDSAGNTATIKTLNNNANLTITLPDVSGQLLTYTTADAQYLNKADTTAMLTNYQRTSAFPIATFGAGSGASGDTSAFTTSAIYGSFYNSGVDTIILTAYNAVLQGTSPSITPTIYINDTLNATAVATKVVNSPSAVTSTTLGNTVTSLNNTKIPPGNYVWVRTETVGTKPTYFSLTLIGFRKR